MVTNGRCVTALWTRAAISSVRDRWLLLPSLAPLPRVAPSPSIFSLLLTNLVILPSPLLSSHLLSSHLLSSSQPGTVNTVSSQRLMPSPHATETWPPGTVSGRDRSTSSPLTLSQLPRLDESTSSSSTTLRSNSRSHTVSSRRKSRASLSPPVLTPSTKR